MKAVIAVGLLTLALTGCSGQVHSQSVPPPPDDDSALVQLFMPPQPPPDLVCFPWMNLLRIDGCPMVIV